MAAVVRAAFIVLMTYVAAIRSKYVRADGESEVVIGTVLTSLEKLLGYYKTDVKNLNLDGFFGLRVLEGHLLLILKDFKKGDLRNLTKDVLLRIQALTSASSIISEDGLDHVRRDNPKYFDDFSPVVKKPWAVLKPHRKLDPALRWEIPQLKAKVKAQLSEETSDKCLKELMRPSSPKCIISDQCIAIMTTRGFTGYSLTHQLLWSILGEMSVTCNDTLQILLKKHGIDSTDSFQLEMCTNNFYEMVAVVHVLMKGKIHQSHQDLFLEQQMVCPSLGFYEFIKKDYLDQILSWQLPSGCFGDDEEKPDDQDDLDIADLLEGYHNRNEKVKSSHEGLLQKSRKKIRSGRKLLVEKELDGGCLSHKTGVGAGALVIYLRYLIQSGHVQWDGPHRLFEEESQKFAQSNGKVRMEEDFSDDNYNDINVDEEGEDEEGEEEEEDAADDLAENDYDNMKHYEHVNVNLKNLKKGGSLLPPKPAQNNFKSQSNHLKLQPTDLVKLDKGKGGDKESNFYNDHEKDDYYNSLEESKGAMKSKIPDNKIEEDPAEFVLKAQQFKMGMNGKSSNFLYGQRGEEVIASNHPGILLIVLVSVSPILIISFFLFKFMRCSKIYNNICSYHL